MLLIFDLDGTLVDCKDLHQQGFRSAVYEVCPFAKFEDDEIEGLPTTKKIDYLRYKGYDIPDIVDTLKKHNTNLYFESYIQFNKEMLDHFDRLHKKYKLALASNSRSEFVFRCMNILKLWHFEIVLSRDYGPAKPDPWMYNKCMKICKESPDQTYIFEDSPVGIEGALKTGAKVVEIKDSKHLVEKLYEF
mgnify:CR=1 FL=1